MHWRTQIKNATVVNEGERFVGSVLLDGDRIEEVVRGADVQPLIPPDRVVDGTGCYLLPGIIDTHVHFREPGWAYKADIDTESRAAVAGGVTTIFDMPNTVPQTVTHEAFDAKLRLMGQKCHVNYGLYFGATRDNAGELAQLDPMKVCAIKLFMGASTGNMLVDADDTLHCIFGNARLPIVAHCEDTAQIERNMAEAVEACGGEPPVGMHTQIRSAQACYDSTRKAVRLARETGARLHVAHVSTARELELFDEAYPHVTAEICLPHLLFCEDDYPRLGTRIKCNPSVKTAADREALRRALNHKMVKTVGTDHAPHAIWEKCGGARKAVSGMPMIQYSLVSMLELADAGYLSLERLVELMCHNPARLFNIENRGFLREGYQADLVLVRPHSPWTVTPSRIQSKCNWSPMEGHVYHWRVERTYVGGFPLYNRGHVTDDDFLGQAVTYYRCR